VNRGFPLFTTIKPCSSTSLHHSPDTPYIPHFYFSFFFFSPLGGSFSTSSSALSSHLPRRIILILVPSLCFLFVFPPNPTYPLVLSRPFPLLITPPLLTLHSTSHFPPYFSPAHPQTFYLLSTLFPHFFNSPVAFLLSQHSHTQTSSSGNLVVVST